jgi:hypothetical protein
VDAEPVLGELVAALEYLTALGARELHSLNYEEKTERKNRN